MRQLQPCGAEVARHMHDPNSILDAPWAAARVHLIRLPLSAKPSGA